MTDPRGVPRRRHAPERVVAVGGGTRATLWTQIVSDVTGLAQHVPTQTIGASYGDALLAAIGAGLVPPETDWSRTDHVVVPDTNAGEVYDELFELFTSLYPATAEIVHRLADLQTEAVDERENSITALAGAEAEVVEA